MSDSLNEAGLSDLEKEFELEMEAEPEGETSEEELELETELELGADSQEVSDEELEFEVGEELELELDQKAEQFAKNLYELSTKEFESEIEQETELDKIIAEMEQEYFFKGLVDKLKTAGKELIKKGLKLAPKLLGKIPLVGDAVKTVTHLARGNFKGAVGTLGKGLLKAGLSATGVGIPAVAAMNAVGFEIGQPEVNRSAWRRYVAISREGFNYLAENLREDSDEPEEASRLGSDAFRHAVRKYRRRHPRMRRLKSQINREVEEQEDAPAAQQQSAPAAQQQGASAKRPRRRVVRHVIRMRPGHTLIIKS